MLTTDKKKFADEMQEIIDLIERGECKFHSFEAAPSIRRVEQNKGTDFKSIYAVEFKLTVVTDREVNL